MVEVQVERFVCVFVFLVSFRAVFERASFYSPYECLNRMRLIAIVALPSNHNTHQLI